MIVTSECHGAPVRKMLNGKYFCQNCGQECAVDTEEELTDIVDSD